MMMMFGDIIFGICILFFVHSKTFVPVKSMPVSFREDDNLMCFQPQTANFWICNNKNDVKHLIMSDPSENDSKEDEEQNKNASDNNQDISEKRESRKPLDDYYMLKRILKRIESKSKAFVNDRVKKRPFDSISYGSVFGGFG